MKKFGLRVDLVLTYICIMGPGKAPYMGLPAAPQGLRRQLPGPVKDPYIVIVVRVGSRGMFQVLLVLSATLQSSGHHRPSGSSL